MYTSELLAKRIKQGRIYRGMTQKELADACELHINTYRRIEGDGTSLKADKLGVIANILNLDISFFYLVEMTLDNADFTKTPPESMQAVLEKIDSISNLIKFNNHSSLLHFLQSDETYRNFSLQLLNLPHHIRRRVLDRLQGNVEAIIEDFKNTPGEEKDFKIPFYGLIYDGMLHNTTEYFGESVLAPIEYLKAPGEYYAVKVMDESLKLLNVEPNTVVILKAEKTIQSGEIGFFEVDSVVFLKKVAMKNRKVELVSCTADCTKKTYEKKNVKVLGRYVGALKKS